MPADLLPILAGGTKFPRETTENKAKGWTGTFKLPSPDLWKRFRYRDLPYTLKRAVEFSEEIAEGIVYRLEVNDRTYWLPAIELARMLFFHSSEVTRAAINQGNTWQLGKAWQHDWTGELQFSSNIPVRYLNSLQFRKFFAWLFFVPRGLEKALVRSSIILTPWHS